MQAEDIKKLNKLVFNDTIKHFRQNVFLDMTINVTLIGNYNLEIRFINQCETNLKCFHFHFNGNSCFSNDVLQLFR